MGMVQVQLFIVHITAGSWHAKKCCTIANEAVKSAAGTSTSAYLTAHNTDAGMRMVHRHDKVTRFHSQRPAEFESWFASTHASAVHNK